jgi:hypothetical protein
MTNGRYIDMTPTWPEAARIIAAALENGTGAGRDAARAELFRMADVLHTLNTRQPEGISLWEVITEASTGQPFGMTFTDEATATDYANAMKAAEYSANVSLPFKTQPTLDEAMDVAATFYGHPELADMDGQQSPGRVIYVHGKPYPDPGDDA